jgi:hypothetical protein
VETAADAEPAADVGAGVGAGAGAETRVVGGLPCPSPRGFSASLCVRLAGLAAGGVLGCAECLGLSPGCWVGSRGVGCRVERVGLLGFWLGFGLGLGRGLVRSAGRGRSGMSFQFGVGGWLSGVRAEGLERVREWEGEERLRRCGAVLFAPGGGCGLVVVPVIALALDLSPSNSGDDAGDVAVLVALLALLALPTLFHPSSFLS